MGNLQNGKKTIENSRISKYQNKNLSKFIRRRKANTPSPPLLTMRMWVQIS